MRVRKRQSGLMLRLVDIVLILLFGFLAIAKIRSQSEIELPQSKADNSAVATNETYFEVFIYPSGEVKPQGSRALAVQVPLPNKDLAGWNKAYEQLKQHIGDRNGGNLPVAIMSHQEAPVQYTKDIMDICKELGMKKFIRVFDTRVTEGDE